MIGIGTVKFHFGLQWHRIGQATLKALFDSVARWIDIVIEEFKDKVVASVRNGKILSKHFIESLVFSFFSWSIYAKLTRVCLVTDIEKFN